MPIIRVGKINNNSILENNYIFDKSLSLKAKGIMTLILPLGEKDNCSVEVLAMYANDGRDSIKNALKELEDREYLTRIKRRDKQGRIRDTVYIVRAEL